ncbi:hypothetical protein F4777DRAFT_567732 [Nemania sp. FL0916]|nr:hypothetical protein F4777DRAFT_567732 [Nemania sp. FL0916]
MASSPLTNAASAALATTVKQSGTVASAGWRLAADQGKKATEWAVANPGTAVAVGVGGLGGVMVAAPMMAAAPVLGAFGFGANGIAVGSVAAGVQSGIGSVVAPGAFATIQSAAAGGYGVAAVSTAVQGMGGVIAGSAAAFSLLKKTGNNEEENVAATKDEKEPLPSSASQEVDLHETVANGGAGKAKL